MKWTAVTQEKENVHTQSEEAEPRASKASQLKAGPLMQFVNPPHKCVAAQNLRIIYLSSIRALDFLNSAKHVLVGKVKT